MTLLVMDITMYRCPDVLASLALGDEEDRQLEIRLECLIDYSIILNTSCKYENLLLCPC